MTQLSGFNPFNLNNRKRAVEYIEQGGKTNKGLKEYLGKYGLKCGNSNLTDLYLIAESTIEIQNKLKNKEL